MALLKRWRLLRRRLRRLALDGYDWRSKWLRLYRRHMERNAANMEYFAVWGIDPEKLDIDAILRDASRHTRAMRRLWALAYRGETGHRLGEKNANV